MTPANDNPTESPETNEASPRERAVWQSLEGVPDPEIPVINVIDLGIIAAVRAGDEGVEVDMTPTFAGCPALDVIRKGIVEAVKAMGEDRVKVNVVYNPPWTSDRITVGGRRKLKEFGLAPPGKRCTGGELPNLESTPCPYCDSINTEMESIFGPTLCRSIHYCHACKQSFEHFKAV